LRVSRQLDDTDQDSGSLRITGVTRGQFATQSITGVLSIGVESNLMEDLETNQAVRIRRLREVAASVRAAILSARDSFPPYLRRKFSAFPKGCCGHTSVLLALYLQDIGLTDVSYVFGGRRGFNVEDAHAWVEVGDVIVDITADQFSDNPNPLVITEERSWHAKFYGDNAFSMCRVQSLGDLAGDRQRFL